MKLSRREQEILARIEDELTRNDAELAAALAEGKPVHRLERSPAVRTWLGLLGLLVLGLLTVILLGVILLDLGPVSLGILTLSVAAPWVLLASSSLARSTAGGQGSTCSISSPQSG